MKKRLQRSYKRTLSILCTMAMILTVFIPSLSVSAATFDETYTYPSNGVQYAAAYNFRNADDYVVANTETANYYSYYTSSGTKPSGTTIQVSDGTLVLSSGAESGASLQTWVINENGVPFELIPGHQYAVSFKVKKNNSVSVSGERAFVALGNGVAANDTAFKAPYDGTTRNFGASASVMPAPAEGVTYSYSTGAHHNYSDSYPNSAISFYQNNNHIVDKYSSLTTSLTNKSKDFVAYDITNNGANAQTKNYLVLIFRLHAGQEITIDDINVYDKTDDRHVFITYNYDDTPDTLKFEYAAQTIGAPITKTATAPAGCVQSGWKTADGKETYYTVPSTQKSLYPNFVNTLTEDSGSITYDFTTASDYELTNGTTSYWSRQYSWPAKAYKQTDGVWSSSQEVIPVENPLAIENGSLVLKPGTDDVDFSIYSTDKSAAMSDSNKRSLVSWVLNKNGIPIELEPGTNYMITVKLKNCSSGAAKSFISISNGVAFDDINSNYWWSDFGANAAVMPASDVSYEYKKFDAKPTNPAVDTYPNTACYIYDASTNFQKAYDSNMLAYAASGESIADGTYTKSFRYYDIISGTNPEKRRNWLALTFCLNPNQSVEIEEITVSFDYSKITNITYDFGNGVTKKETAEVGDAITETASKAGHRFIGWKDSAGNIYETVPSVEGGSITLYPAYVTALDDSVQEISLDFTREEEYALDNSSGTFLSYYRPGTGDSKVDESAGVVAYSGADLKAAVIEAQANSQTVQIVEDTQNNNNKVLAISSGLPADAKQFTLQSWVVNKNGNPIEIDPGSYYAISIKLREKTAPTFGREGSFVTLANGIAFDDVNQNYWWTNFGATASMMPEKDDAVYSYLRGGDTHSKTNTDYPNTAVRRDSNNYNALVWTNSNNGYSSDYYTTIEKTYLGYDITEGGSANRKNYLALNFGLRSGQVLYIDDITVTKVHKITFETDGLANVKSKFATCGTTIKLPSATAEDYRFVAWCTDADCEKPLGQYYSATNQDATLYALWYEDADVSTDPLNVGYEIYDACENIEEIDETGNFNVTSGSSSAKIAVANSSGSGCFNISDGGKYKITFEYLLTNNTGSANINAYVGDTQADSYALKATSSNGWQQGQIVFIAKPEGHLEDGQYLLSNSLFLGVDSLASGAECSFKNIKVSFVDEPIVTVDRNLGENKFEYVIYDNEFELGTPDRDGFVFTSWYNSLTEEAVNNETVFENDATVYADWITEYIYGDINADSELNLLDLVRLKKVIAHVYTDSVSVNRANFNGNSTDVDNLIVLRKLLLGLEVSPYVTTLISGIDINNYCVSYEPGGNVLLNEAVASLNTALGNPAGNNDFKIIISDNSNIENGILVSGVNLVINSADPDRLISYVNQFKRMYTRYNGQYKLGFNAGTVYGNTRISQSDYSLMVSDEFDGDELSAYWAKLNPSTSIASYSDGSSLIKTFKIANKDAVAVTNGAAVLNASAVSNDGSQSFTTQFIQSDFKFTYGYLEAKIKIAENPATSSFWLKHAVGNNSVSTGRHSEIDMFETLNNDPNNDCMLNANLHSWGEGTEHYSLDDWNSEYGGGQHEAALSKKYTSDVKLSAGYHIYAVKWDSQSVTYYIDGEEYFSYNYADPDSYLGTINGENNADTFRHPMKVIISSGMGGYNYGPLWTIGDLASSNVQIDYVRLYQSEADGGTFYY